MKKHEGRRKPTSTLKAATRLGISISFLYRHQHDLPGKLRVGRCLRWDVEVLREHLRERAISAAK